MRWYTIEISMLLFSCQYRQDRTVLMGEEHCIDHLRHSIMCSGNFALDHWKYDAETNRRNRRAACL